jgi:hypothetical protein
MNSVIDDVEEPGRQWERLCGTSDVPSSMSFGVDPEGRIWLHFEFLEEGFLDTPLDDFLLIFRLFNMAWSSHLIRNLDLCLNPNCHNTPYGGHQRKADCVPVAEFQREILENNELEMQRLQRAKSIAQPLPDGVLSLEPLPEGEA